LNCFSLYSVDKLKVITTYTVKNKCKKCRTPELLLFIQCR